MKKFLKKGLMGASFLVASTALQAQTVFVNYTRLAKDEYYRGLKEQEIADHAAAYFGPEFRTMQMTGFDDFSAAIHLDSAQGSVPCILLFAEKRYVLQNDRATTAHYAVIQKNYYDVNRDGRIDMSDPKESGSETFYCTGKKKTENKDLVESVTIQSCMMPDYSNLLIQSAALDKSGTLRQINRTGMPASNQRFLDNFYKAAAQINTPSFLTAAVDKRFAFAPRQE